MKRIPTPSGTEDTSIDAAETDVYVLGGGTVGAAVARRLQAEDHAVALIDESDEPSDLSVHRANPTDVEALTEAGLEGTSTVVTSSDSRYLLIAQLVRARFDLDRILVLTNEPDRVEVIADTGHEPVCVSTALADTLVDRL